MTEFSVLSFDGWATLWNESVLGIMSSRLDDSLEIRTNFLGNLRIDLGRSANGVAKLLRFVVSESFPERVAKYFVSDSAHINEAAVRMHMVEVEDGCWFSCSFHFFRFALRDSVT